MLTKYFYTPMHCCVSNLFVSFIMWIRLLISDFRAEPILSRVCGYVLLTIGELIYNEIVICYKFNLEVNTKKEIAIRSEYDFNKDISLMEMNVDIPILF